MHGPMFPATFPGQIIGLFGGSFDPPHRGHVLVSESARVRFNLDEIWWLVTPGNPLKSRQPARVEDRVAACEKLVSNPRTKILNIETKLGTRATADTINELQKRFPHVRFVWIMGADNLASFHKWQNWRDIMNSVPVGVIARPGMRAATGSSPAASIYSWARLKGRASHVLGQYQPPVWAFANVPMMDISSTALRNERGVS